jgi:adenine-specific DNA-methyltransferase
LKGLAEMATGVPRKGSGDNGWRNTPELTYDGKAPVREVLDAKAPEIRCLWNGGGETENGLYFGENSGILAELMHDSSIKGKVRLVYIDPPFSTQSSFYSRKQRHAYEDTRVGANYVEFLRRRILLLRELLADDGSLYLHLDEKMVFHMKVVLDEIFGAGNFRNCIVRKKCNPKNYTRKKYGNIVDYILFYTKTGNYVWTKPIEPWTEERAKEYQYIEEGTGRRFMKVPLHAPGVRNGETGKPWRGMMPPPGKHWQYLPSKLDKMDARAEIYWSPNGNPRRKVYLDKSPGVGVQDVWFDFRDAHNQNVRITGYPTEKNPDLLRRIIQASSKPGDAVLDCFCGSGTSLAVAHELGRRWIGVDNSVEAIQTTLTRFLEGTERMGDFVNGKKGNDYSKGRERLLFESLKDEGVGKKMEQHSPILQFQMFAEVERARELDNVLAKWKDKVGGIEKAQEVPVGRF